MKRRVVITGIGPATAIGTGKKEFTTGIFNLKTIIEKVPENFENNYRFKSRHFVPKPKVDLKELGIHKSISGMMEEAAKLAVLCSKLALDDAGIEIHNGGRLWQAVGMENCSVIIGIGMSSLQTALESYTAHIAGTNIQREGTPLNQPRFNRMVIPMMMTNSPAAWISILYGLKGLSYTVNASCASGSCAIGESYRNISSGRCDAALTGGVEVLAEKNGAIMRGFDMLTTLTKSEDGKPLPFSRQRSGFLFNEGAGCILLLEELERAKKRGAAIYAEIVGYESSSDAYSIVQMDPQGKSITDLFQRITADGIKVDYLNAHGTATVSNDEIEALIIQQVFGSKRHQPVINSTKGILGHSIGASGALEAAVTAISIKESRIHGNITIDPLDNLNLPLKTIEREIEYALSASYGFGGHNALLLFKRYHQ